MITSKKIVLICPQIPNSFYGGGALTSLSVLRSFLKQGYAVTVLTWPAREEKQDQQAANELKKYGAKIIFLNPLKDRSYLKLFNFSSVDKPLPHSRARGEVEKIISDINPKAVVMYHWEALSAGSGIKSFLKIGLVGDPVHLPYLFRSEVEKRQKVPFSGLKEKIINLRVKNQIQFMKHALLECDCCGAFAWHHAQMFKEMGVEGCRYFRTPVPDPLDGAARKRSLLAKPKILLLGHLKGIATLSGISLFADEVLPALERKLGRENFEVHIVGGFFETIPESLKRKLLSPSVIVRGHISPADEEFLSSHLILVPTPIELGIRVRIISALSFGTPVVAHSANKLGIPELEHGKNALLANTGEEIAEEVTRLIKDEHLLRSLSENGRKTYEDFFSLDTAGLAIVEATQSLFS